MTCRVLAEAGLAVVAEILAVALTPLDIYGEVFIPSRGLAFLNIMATKYNRHCFKFELTGLTNYFKNLFVKITFLDNLSSNLEV